MEFGEKLRNARLAKQMSQPELAKASGMSIRTIQNYESNERLPKKAETYTKLAEALGIDERVLLDDNASFIIRANQQFGERGAKQAWNMVSDINAMFAGGEIASEDMEEIIHALQTAYWEAKEKNRKYINKRYLKETDNDNNGEANF